jgi:hypothetical protein
MPRGPTRRRSCKVCQLPASERDLVTGALRSGGSARSISPRFGTLNRTAVAFHAKNCLSEGEE